ncbi:orotate phosphoribosyltransferase [Alkalihalobacillus sp. AL-G]|uniref:orotate phosphoribosyltransferase n=1 Tax=Alkalihalobacillus sp. AL-G TaxID=2926399 RepID=UPI00272C79F8|nr:orotate phosphoribosyltransferase [Alkalihalobacillus sp. AL-G]WLD95096.1 orotate phosphoribosyltransferase [Alkalihalobacillus sp. AL-G]
MKKKIAKHLLQIGAVSLSPEDPFTWSSGMKSPIYCDNRLTLSYPEVRNDIVDQLVSLIQSSYPEAEVIAGTATAGIPHAALVADRMGLPMVYVRSKAKAHGKGKQIEGTFSSGSKVVVIEDLISTGKSVINATEALRAGAADVLGCAAIFSYQLKKGTTALEQANLDVRTLSDFSTLIEVAASEGIIKQESVAELTHWCVEPELWKYAK